MSQYISGAFKPKQKRTYLLAQALDVDEAWLMGYDVPMERIISNNTDLLLQGNYNPLEYRSSSDVVKYLRESKNMTRAEFASVLHCTEKTIKNIEEGHKLVSINLARKYPIVSDYRCRIHYFRLHCTTDIKNSTKEIVRSLIHFLSRTKKNM